MSATTDGWCPFLEEAAAAFLRLHNQPPRMVAVALGKRFDPSPCAAKSEPWSEETNRKLVVRTFGCGPRSGPPLSRFHVILGGAREYADEDSQKLQRQGNLLRQSSRSALAGAMARGTTSLLARQVMLPTDTTECLAEWCWLVFELAWRANDETLRAEKTFYADVSLQEPLRDIMAFSAAFRGLPVELRCQGVSGMLAAAASWVEARGPHEVENEIRTRLADLPGIELQQQIGCWYSVLPDFAYASAAACRILLATTDDGASPHQNAAESVSGNTLPVQPPKTPFTGGELALFEDWAELCGVRICAGGRSAMKRRLLDVLSEKATDGHFRAFSARELGERLGVGEDAVAGIVRGIRDEITKVLEAKGLVCGKDCVILSGGPGYRLAASISVGTASPTVRSTAEGTRRVTKPSVTDRPVTDDTDPHVTNVTDRVTDDLASPAELAEGPARQAWIVQQLSAGVKLSVDHVVRLFGCTRRTALRDLEALKRAGRIEYCGPARTGHYRLTKGQGR